MSSEPNQTMHRFTKTGPLTKEDLAELRDRLKKLNDKELLSEYNACLHMCQLNYGSAPRASYVQQLVQTWKVLKRRQKP